MSSTATLPILVVDDEPDLRELYELTLLRAGYQVTVAPSVTAACALISAQRFAAVITDMRLSDGLGLQVLQHLQQLGRKERGIVITAYGSAENAVESLKAGAFDYLSKPVDLKQLRGVVAAAVAETSALAPTPAPSAASIAAPAPSKPVRPAPHLAVSSAADLPPASPSTTPLALARIVGQSAVMQGVRERIVKVSRGMAPILIRGESGTGKELVAQAVHACSQRAAGPFVAVNCGAIPENLLEAEFFGARKGAYTGATQDREGYFQAANGGTLFLDELGDLPISMQAKLLRAIQERIVRPIGSTKEESVDVRLVSATHHDLAQAVEQGRFRQDLFYRLNVIELVLPPLRERREDIPSIAARLLEKIHGDTATTPLLRPDALELLMQHPLAGNVRELENLLQRALAMSDGSSISAADFDLLQRTAMPVPDVVPVVAPPSAPMLTAAITETALPTTAHLMRAEDALIHDPAQEPPIPPCPETLPRDLTAWLDALEKAILQKALLMYNFNRTAAANRLGISARQIRYRMQQLGIRAEQSSEEAHE